MLTGALLTWWVWRPTLDGFSWVVLLLGSLALVPSVREGLLRWMAKLDGIGEREVWKLGLGVFVVALGVWLEGAYFRREYLGPKSHDEHSYALGALMLASGRLWAPSPAAADSFESFHMLTRPVYASIYSPGTAMLYVPGVWLGVPAWVTASVISAVAVTLGFLLMRRVVSTSAGLVGAVGMLGARSLRDQSILGMSQVPSLAVGLGVLLSACRWAEGPTGRQGMVRAAIVGVLGGLLCVIRPQDGAWVLPGALVMTVPMLRRDWRVWARGAVVAGVCAGPFGAVQLVQNYGLTGSVLHSGYWAYTKAMQPGTGFGGGEANVSTTRPATLVRQKAEYNDSFGGLARSFWRRGFVEGVVRARLHVLTTTTLPSGLLLAVVPLGLMQLARSNAGRAIIVCLAGFAGLYGSFTFFLPHYTVVIAGVMMTVVVAAPAGAGWLLGSVNGESWARLGVGLLIVGATLTWVPGLNPSAADQDMRTVELQWADEVERQVPYKPAIVMFRYAEGSKKAFNLHEEPVYNLQSWRLEENEVLRAHDLGPELNDVLLRAWGDKGGRRRVYLADRVSMHVTDLGWADEFLKERQAADEHGSQKAKTAADGARE